MFTSVTEFISGMFQLHMVGVMDYWWSFQIMCIYDWRFLFMVICCSIWLNCLLVQKIALSLYVSWCQELRVLNSRDLVSLLLFHFWVAVPFPNCCSISELLFHFWIAFLLFLFTFIHWYCVGGGSRLSRDTADAIMLPDPRSIL